MKRDGGYSTITITRLFCRNKTLRRPIAVEGRIQGQLQAEGVEFRLSGRYDRLDALEDGLELVDYKSTRNPKRPDPNLIDLQMGLYYLALGAAISSVSEAHQFAIPENRRKT